MKTKMLSNAVAVALLVGALSGCATTGDPSKGGLFCRSEPKAKSRQRDLAKQLDDAQADADGESGKTRTLLHQRTQAQDKLVSVRGKIAQCEQKKEGLESAPAIGDEQIEQKRREIAKLNAEIARLKVKEKEFAEQSRL